MRGLVQAEPGRGGGGRADPDPGPGGDWPTAAGGGAGPGSLPPPGPSEGASPAAAVATAAAGAGPPRRCPGKEAGAARCGRGEGGGLFLLPPGPDSALGGGTRLAPRPARAAVGPGLSGRGKSAPLFSARAPKARDPVSSGPNPPLLPLDATTTCEP
ncbi:hypothetical protein MC885_001727 [Smutsia gigantea]|nr:hypothetical protein MC885_001727 [Smutsia gigantea]